MLPSNAILDLDTFSMYFTGTTTCTSSTGSAGACCFPKNIESIIRNLNVQCADRTIDNILEYNRIFNTMMDHMSGTSSDFKRQVMCNGGLNVQEKIEAVSGSGWSIANETGTRYAIHTWLGFLGSCRPRLIDASVMNPLKVTIELAPSQILVQNATATNPSYTLGDIYFTIDVINVMDGMLSAQYQKMLASSPDAIMEFPYARWQMYSGPASAQGTTIFNVSSQSLDYVVSFFSPAPSAQNTWTDSYGTNTSATLGTSTYFLRPSAFTNANVTFEVRDWQYSIGGRQLPAWPVTNDLTFSQNLDTMQANRDLLGGITPTLFSLGPDTTHTIPSGSVTSAYGYNNSPFAKNYLSAYAAFMLRLNNDSEPGWITGLNTSGNVLYNQFTWNGTGTNLTNGILQNFVFIRCTSSFVVKYGRQAEVIW
jgi:hypothetical protein